LAFFGSLGDMRVKGVEHATEGTDSGGAHESITFVSGRHAMLFGRLVGCLAGITLTRTPAGWRLPLYWLAKRCEATELFWRAECVQVIYNDVARVAVWNLHASLRFARLRVTVCDGNPVGTLLATR
jgi:hypothetical protein